MADLDVRLLRAFVAVAEELNFSRAAERLGLAQQGLSAQIRQLEARLGARVFKRTTRRVAPTPAGEALLPHARAVLAEIDAAVAAVRDIEESAASELAVAGLENAPGVGPELLERFAAACPDVGVAVREVSPAQELLDESAGPAGAAAFVRPPFRGFNRYSTVVLGEEPRVAALAADHPLADRDSVEPSELTSAPWVLIGRDRVAEAFWLLEEHRRGRAAQVQRRPASWDELLAAVAQDGAVALLPESIARALEPDHPGVRTVAVTGIEPSRLALAWRPANETPAVRQLAEVARELTGANPF